jgi:hypothetical protein
MGGGWNWFWTMSKEEETKKETKKERKRQRRKEGLKGEVNVLVLN